VTVAAIRPGNFRGFTLVEAIVAMMLLVIGGVGALGLANQSVKMNGDARKTTRATAIAQDLVANIGLWPYADLRLVNTTGSNDADIADAALTFESAANPVTDHVEADLTANGAVWLGVPQSELAVGGYQRYWNVSEGDDWDGNGTPDLKRIAVIVRWPQGAGYRRIVLFSSKVNPADAQ
jgi:type II secretory pathway pseudopilin PulG